MMFKKEFLDGIVSGEITRTYRRWKRPQVKTDGVYQLMFKRGAIQVTDISTANEESVSDNAAKLSGFDGAKSLLDYLGYSSNNELYCINFIYVGTVAKEGPDQTAITSETEWQTLADKLAKKDRSSGIGPWTLTTLTLIGESPGTTSRYLAESLKRIQMDLKKDIRKLKQLGLTMSLETGYKLTDRGKSYLALARKRPG